MPSAEHHRLFEAAFEANEDALLVIHEGGITLANPSAHALLRAEQGALPGASIERFIDSSQPDGRDAMSTMLEQSARALAGEAPQLRYIGRRLDGERFVAEVTLTRVERTPPLLLATVRDITTKEANELAHARSEALFFAVAEGRLDSMFVLKSLRDRTGKLIDFVFTYVNARARSLLTLPIEEVLGKQLCVIMPVNRTHGFFDKYVRVVESRTPLEEEFSTASPTVVAKWMRHQIVPLGDGIVITSRDITEQKNEERALEETRRRLEAHADELSRKNRLLEEEKTYREHTARELAARQHSILALSAPLIHVDEGVLALPIIGELSDERGAHMLERLLAEVKKTEVRYAILDLTGLSQVDKAAVHWLERMIGAVELLGGRCLVSGLSPRMALAISEAGGALRLQAFALLEDAIGFAIRARAPWTSARAPRSTRRSPFHWSRDP